MTSLPKKISNHVSKQWVRFPSESLGQMRSNWALDQKHISKQVKHNFQGEISLTFQIKTTEPKNYMVRPNYGVVMVGDFEKVIITLSSVPASVSNHKFMVQVAETHLTNAQDDF